MELPVIEQVKPNTAELLPLGEYSKVIVSYSGGKDSTALVAWCLRNGISAERMELWHQDVDGGGDLMDWPCTPAYVQAVGRALGIRVRVQWRIGGFEGEMCRKDKLTNPVRFELLDGNIGQGGGVRGKLTTRELFPQVSPDLSVRWCSPYLKIDVAALALNNDPTLASGRVLFLTGERRQESTARSRYAQTELHRCHRESRLVHQHRAVIDWSEQEVWAAVRELGVVPHVAYYLGYGRLSCQHCIFMDANQAATNRHIDPVRWARLVEFERRWGKTIKRGQTLDQLADKGTIHPEVLASPDLVRLAMGREYTVPVLSSLWELPAGAYKRGGGPS